MGPAGLAVALRAAARAPPPSSASHRRPVRSPAHRVHPPARPACPGCPQSPGRGDGQGEGYDPRHPRPPLEVVLEASLEVRSAVVYATIIVVLVFVPVYFLDGLPGAFFRPLAVAYGLGVLASMVVALTVTPALALILLPRSGSAHREAPLGAWLRRRYERFLPWLLDHPRGVLAVLVATFALAGASGARLGEGFLPEFQETDFLMHWVGKPGTSLEAMRRTTTRVSRELRAIPGVRNFGSHNGRAEVPDEGVGPNITQARITPAPNCDHTPAAAPNRATGGSARAHHRDVGRPRLTHH